ncbi:MAG TPA: M20/M25/M40 family metallo-hydrolase [Thermoanaerobaculia bacterium]|nr:M20/M25/M40 family metallo-hydrolase [Thermoanaerobaculia bacterium]
MTDSESREAAKKRRHRNERIAAAVFIVLAAAITAGLMRWAEFEREQLESDQRYIPKNTQMTPELRLLQEFVRIDTSTPAGAAAGARWVAGYLRKHGVTAEIIESAPDRLNVYARIRGRDRGEGLLLFNHIDVVPPGPGWTAPPFEGVIGLNSLFGRGTLDMKGLALCQMLVFIEIARSGRPPAHDLVFLATADEETGSEYGMQWIIAHRPDVLEGVKFGLTEGGITEMMTEQMTYFGIEVGGKQPVSFTILGDDLQSMEAARIALEPLMFPREPERVLPVVRRYFRDLAPTRMAFKPMLADIDGTIAQGQFWRLPAPYRDHTQNSLWVYAPVRSGDGWSMFVRQANLPDEQPDERMAVILKTVERYGLRLGTVSQKQGPVPISPDDTPLFRILAGEAERRYKVQAGLQLLYRSASDSRFLRPLGIVCYGISPYPVDFYQSTSIHGVDERIRLDFFMEGVGYMRNVVKEWAGAS